MILGTDSLALEYRIGFNDKMNLGRVHFFTFLFVIIDIKVYSINDWIKNKSRSYTNLFSWLIIQKTAIH